MESVQGDFVTNLIQSDLFQYIKMASQVVLLVLVGWFGGMWARRGILKSARKMGFDEILWGYFGTVVRYTIMIVSFTTAIRMAGIDISPILATFGISGVIIGLGARQSISNYFFGIMMLSARPFKRGDLIEFGPPPQIGVVREVKMTYTAMDTLDNVRLVVPNSVVWRGKITNFSVHTDRAIKITIKFGYDVDVDWVRDLAVNVLYDHSAVLNNPEPRFTLGNMTSDHVIAQLVAWSRVETMTVFGDVITQMRKAFETAGLSVVVPAGDIDLKREE
jgi:small conductance mechanosensitive channel